MCYILYMKKILSIFIFALVFTAVGCSIKEEYSVQYGFRSEAANQTKIEQRGDIIAVEIPLPEFSCDVASFKSVLERKGDVFTLTFKGTETTERCLEKYTAEISGVKPGSYWLRVVYERGAQATPLLYQAFTVTK